MKMKSAVIILLSVLSVLLFNSCKKVTGEGPIVSEIRPVSGFKSISVSISGKVNYRIDPVYKVEILAQQNILDILQTNLAGDELVIKFRDGKRAGAHEDIVVNVSAPFAERVQLNGSAEFSLANKILSDKLKLNVSGSGNINVAEAGISDLLTGVVSGSGNIIVADGSAKNADLTISGSGSIRAGNVVSEEAITTISGSGNMEVNPSKKLDATISGSGSVYYHGNPVISTRISGSGQVKPF